MVRPAPATIGYGGAVSRQVDLDGPVHYLDYGGPPEGPLLVAVHGLGGSALNWSALAPHLTHSYRLLALDLVGHGRTHSMGRSAAVPANTLLVRRFIESLADEPVVVLGNSMGGMIALHLAAEHADVVSGLALVDPALPAVFARPDPLVAAVFAVYSIPGVGPSAIRARRRVLTPEVTAQQILALCCHDASRVPSELIAEEVQQARERLAMRNVEADFVDAARSVVRTIARRRHYHSRLRRVSVPVLLIHGTQDRLVPVAAARAVARAYPHWTYRELLDVGHVPQLEAAADTAHAMLQWLTDGFQQRASPA